MHTFAQYLHAEAAHPVHVDVEPATGERDRLTVAFRPILAIPHLILVGGPIALGAWWGFQTEPNSRHEWSASGGVLGAVASVAAVISWFAILFAGRHPEGLRGLTSFYLRWRVRAAAYYSLLRDEYPPFGDAEYPATVTVSPVTSPRNKLTVAFRCILVIPHIIALCFLGVAWLFATIGAWFAILFTGYFPEMLKHFSVGVLRWNIRVEAYALLLHDEYPPFSLDA